MGNKKPPPKKSDEEKAAEKLAKLHVSMLKAVKNDEKLKVEECIDQGADVNFANERGQTAGHVAAAFGALETLRYLYSKGADFTLQDEKKMVPKDVAIKIGETDAAALIDALLAGLSGEDIGLGKDLDDLDMADIPDTPRSTDGDAATPRASDAAAKADSKVNATAAAAAAAESTAASVEIA